jgi:hypothetical protein
MLDSAVSHHGASAGVLRAGSRARHAVVAAALSLFMAAAVALMVLGGDGEGLERGAARRPVELAIQIPGIDTETQDHINSGEWTEAAVKEDIRLGLLPSDLVDKAGQVRPSSSTRASLRVGFQSFVARRQALFMGQLVETTCCGSWVRNLELQYCARLWTDVRSLALTQSFWTRFRSKVDGFVPHTQHFNLRRLSQPE